MARWCAVASCKRWHGGKSKKKKIEGCSFFKFPKDKTLRTLWVSKCKRADPFDPSKSFVCSEHFASEAFDPAYLTKMKLMPTESHRALLKPDAIPTLHLPSKYPCGDAKGERLKRRTIMKTVNSLLRQQHEQPDCSSVAGENGQPEIPEGNRRILKSSAQVRRLKKEIARLRAQRRSEQLKWQRHIARLRREICQLRRRVASGSLLEGRMGDILSQQQLRRLSTGRRTCWKSEDVSKAIGLRCISRKAYAYVLHSMQIPLPSESTLSRWTRTFQLGLGGMIHAAVWVLQAAVQEMSAMDRVCCICFDEMSINRRPTYDQNADVVLCGGKLQLMMVRGVCAPWKQPFWQELDAPVTTEKLTAVVRTLEGLGLDVRAVTSDMGSTNEALWRDAGVNLQKTWISHPTDSTKKLWVFADVPHLVKLVRHHVVKDNGGLLVPDGCGGTVLLDAAPFRELRALDSGEMKICPKLTDLCIEARNQTAQRVYLATRLFSGTVATAMEAVLGKPAVARAVRIIDRWFDVLNSRCCSDPKLERQAYGSSEDAKAAQDSALRDMEHLIANARKPGARRLLGPASAVALLPFQRGILRSTASVRGLYEDLTRAYPGQLRFILTSRLNQDCLENAFSQLRGMGGQSTNPDAVEVRQRLRAMLMAPSALRAISCPERAVEVESGPTDYLSTGRPPVASVSANPRAPSMAELEGLTIEFISDEMDDDDAVEVDHSYSRATGAQQPADGDPGSELGLEREGLAFVAGYVAYKMKHVDASLGCVTSEATDELLQSVPSSWLTTISRGRLYLPSPRWMAIVEEFNTEFCRIMGSDFSREAGIIKRLVESITAQCPGLDVRVARRLAQTRLHVRIRWLRQKLDAGRKRDSKQVRQHVASQQRYD